MASKLTQVEVLRRFKSVHGKRYGYDAFVYADAKSNGTIICREHGEFQQSYESHFIQKSGCPKCSFAKSKHNLAWFLERAASIHNKKYDYSKFEYTGINDKSTIICGKHGEFLMSAHVHITQECGCSKCVIESQTNTLGKFVREARNIHGDKYDYSKFVYKNLQTKGIVICPKHGEFGVTAASHCNRQSGCPKCSASKGERFISKILNEMQINYRTQERFDSCRYKKRLPFDFCIGDILIEYDGIHHYKMRPKRGRWQSLRDTIRNDRIKTLWAIQNGKHLYRIKYDMKNSDIKELLKCILTKHRIAFST